MNKERYLRELARALKRLPDQEREAALAWYGEYFDEAGEEKALQTLGTPKETAAKIAGESALKQDDGRKRSPSLWALLALAFPVAAPLAAVALAVAVALVAVLAALMAAGVACAAGGLVVLVKTALGLGAEDNVLLNIGAALAAMGVGGLLTIGVSQAAKGLYRAARSALAKRMTRGEKK